MQAKIYQPTKSAMQSGQFSTSKLSSSNYKWHLVFLTKPGSKFIDRKLGHTAATDTMDQVNLLFDNLNSAIVYAKAHIIDYVIIQNQSSKKTKKSYANNFVSNFN